MSARNVTSDDEVPDGTIQNAPTGSAVADDGEAMQKAVVPEAAVSEAADPETAVVSDPATTSGVAQVDQIPSVPVQTVYITAPTPPKPQGNRGLGTLLAVSAAFFFAVAYAGVAALLIFFVNPTVVSEAFNKFLAGPLYSVPVLAFLVLMILWALLVNRAKWWAWVIGSLVIGAATYFASIGVLLLMFGGFGLTADQAARAFVGFAVNPALIAAALIARETSIWFGALIAKFGRRVRERNYEAWQAFENEEARKRAEFGGVAAV